MPTGIPKNGKSSNALGKHWKLSDEARKNRIRWSIFQKGHTVNNGRKHTAKHNIKIGNAIKQLVENGTHNWLRGDGKTQRQRYEEKAGRKKPKQCEICGAMGKICFDHNHKTGRFRGWICGRCNLTLGMVKDNAELLKTMSDYLNLEKENENQ